MPNLSAVTPAPASAKTVMCQPGAVAERGGTARGCPPPWVTGGGGPQPTFLRGRWATGPGASAMPPALNPRTNRASRDVPDKTARGRPGSRRGGESNVP